MSHIRTVRVIAAAAIAALALAGCASGDEPDAPVAPATGAAETSAPSESAAPAAQWPRTVTIGDQEVTVETEPQRIVALSTETSDLALELVGPERVIGVAQGATTEGMGNQVEAAGQVEHVLNWQQNPDPEQLLALEPDLVLVTERHDGQGSAVDSLAEAGISAVGFSAEDFSTPEQVSTSITALGELLGAEDKAAELVDRLDTKVADVEAAVKDVNERPRTLVLMARGGEQMIMGAHSSTTGLVELAGGTSIAHENGWNAAIPADPEAIIAANPDVILVQDFRGEGLGPFQALLDDPAMAEVSAVANGRVETVPARTTSGTAGAYLGDGLETIAKVLHPDAF